MTSESLKNIRINGKSYNLYHTTGTVVDHKKWNETNITGGGGGGGGRIRTDIVTGEVSGRIKVNPIKVNSETVVRDQLILTSESGQEYDFQLDDFNLACREGNKVSVVHAIKTGKDRGPYIMVYNHNTQNVFFDNKTLLALNKPASFWIFLLFPLLVFVIPFLFAVVAGTIWLLFVGIIIGLLIVRPTFAGFSQTIAAKRTENLKGSNEIKKVTDYLSTI